MNLLQLFKQKVRYFKNKNIPKPFYFIVAYQLIGSLYAQNAEEPMVSLKLKDVTLDQAFKDLGTSTGYNFKYSDEIVNDNRKYTFNFSNKSLSAALAEIATEAGLEYKIDSKNVSVKKLPKKKVSGRLTDSRTGEPLIGATITVKGTTQGTVTDADGNYSIDVYPNESLNFSYIGYENC
ncbi:MAG: hypothetical protein HC905_08440 [Bacteroidales bacterium]|nr:hypothetical protein [Bacteroidales bacterium]